MNPVTLHHTAFPFLPDHNLIAEFIEFMRVCVKHKVIANKVYIPRGSFQGCATSFINFTLFNLSYFIVLEIPTRICGYVCNKSAFRSHFRRRIAKLTNPVESYRSKFVQIWVPTSGKFLKT